MRDPAIWDDDIGTEDTGRVAQTGTMRSGSDGKHRSLLETRMERVGSRDTVDPGECETCPCIAWGEVR